MADQAQGLRALADQARHTSPPSYLDDFSPHAVVSTRATDGSPRRAARTLAITSGKGGVGKTNFTTNLALLLARSGQRVLVVDADLGLANIHVVLGLAPPYHLEHVLRGEKTLREIICPGPCGLQIIAGGSGIAELANLDNAQRQRFIGGLAELDDLADIILVDTGAGLSHNVLGFVLSVEEVIILTTPEPTAITDAYATIKVVSRENPDARLRLVVNMATSDTEAHAAAKRLQLVSDQFLKVQLEVLGHLPQDTSVQRAVRAQMPFVLGTPETPAALALQTICDRIGYRTPSETTAAAGAGGFLNRIARYFGRNAARA